MGKSQIVVVVIRWVVMFSTLDKVVRVSYFIHFTLALKAQLLVRYKIVWVI
jgi:hypothetical protein